MKSVKLTDEWHVWLIVLIQWLVWQVQYIRINNVDDIKSQIQFKSN